MKNQNRTNLISIFPSTLRPYRTWRIHLHEKFVTPFKVHGLQITYSDDKEKRHLQSVAYTESNFSGGGVWSEMHLIKFYFNFKTLWIINKNEFQGAGRGLNSWDPPSEHVMFWYRTGVLSGRQNETLCSALRRWPPTTTTTKYLWRSRVILFIF